jgi:hypothetical protein
LRESINRSGVRELCRACVPTPRESKKGPILLDLCVVRRTLAVPAQIPMPDKA